jgi:t-SNARE complex subunit (syntaxin)
MGTKVNYSNRPFDQILGLDWELGSAEATVKKTAELKAAREIPKNKIRTLKVFIIIFTFFFFLVLYRLFLA